MSFKVGRFDRGKVGWPWRGFCPAEAVNGIVDIDLEALAKRGKKLILIDVDNTLLPWRSEDIPTSTTDWILTAKKHGFDVCILSNTRHKERLKRLSEKLGIDYLLGRFKPSRRMYLAALGKYKRKPEEAIMIGDQLVTDILGANRAGIEAIWVKQMTERDLVTTKFNRIMERLMRGFFYRTLPVEEKLEEEVAEATGKPLTQLPVVRQFAKFVIVGASSFAIDAGLHYILSFYGTWNGKSLASELGTWAGATAPGIFTHFNSPFKAGQAVLKIFTVAAGILNSFIWNRRWTFKIKGGEERGKQFAKFVLVSIIGAVLNTLIFSSLNNVVAGHPRWSWAVATVVATVVVAFWNFTGQRLWAFKSARSAGT